MIRRPILLIFVLLLGIILIPGVIGFQVERQFRALVADISQSMDIEIIEYDRGLLTSRAVTLLHGRVGGRQTSWAIRIEHSIQQGPLFERDKVYLANIHSVFLKDKEHLLKNGVAELFTKVDLFATAKAELNWRDVSVKGRADGWQLTIEQLTGSFIFDPLNKAIDISIDIPQLTVQQAGQLGWQIKQLKLLSTQQKSESEMMIGTTSLGLGEVYMKPVNQAFTVGLTGLQLDYQAKEVKKLLAYTLSIAVGNIGFADKQWGDVDVLLELSSISPDAIDLIQRRVNHFPDNVDVDVYQSLMMPVFMEAMQKMVAYNPSFALKNGHFSSIEGDVDGHFSISVEGLKRMDLSNLSKILNQLKLNAGLTMPESFFYGVFQQQVRHDMLELSDHNKTLNGMSELAFEQQVQLRAATKLQVLLQQHILQRDGKFLSIQADFSEGLMTLNNRLFPLSSLFRAY